jgi:hypothetical protein
VRDVVGQLMGLDLSVPGGSRKLPALPYFGSPDQLRTFIYIFGMRTMRNRAFANESMRVRRCPKMGQTPRRLPFFACYRYMMIHYIYISILYIYISIIWVYK